jgi:putative DNA primase/helicase
MLTATSGAVTVEVHTNGRQQSPVVIYTAERTLAVDVKNVAKASDREALLDKIESYYWEDAAKALDSVAVTVATEPPRAPEKPEPALGFEAPVPWGAPVDGAELLTEMATTVRRFLVLPDGGAEVLALWAVHAWALDAFRVSPILAVTSAEKMSGKSHTMDVVAAMVPRAMRDSNPSDAVVFRVIQKHRPTVMLDEADNIDWRKRPELLGMVNNGYRRAGAFVWRCEGDSFEPTPFSVWAPKVIAGLKPLPDTTASRSIVLRLERKPRDAQVEDLRWDQLWDDTRPLRARALRWATDHVDELRDASPALPEAFSDRQKDNWLPLLAIADLAGGDWPRRAREAAMALRGGRDAADQGSIGEMLLADIRDVFGERDLLPTREILDYLIELQDRPWGEWGSLKKPLSPQGLAAQLRKFGIHPEPKTQREGEKTFKGYARAAFAHAWEIYTPAVTVPGSPCDGSDTRTVTPVTSSGGSALQAVVTDVTVPGRGSKGGEVCSCGNRDAVRWGNRLWCPRCDPRGYVAAVKARAA